MKKYSLLISPRVKSAYFNHYIDVSKAELAYFIQDQEVVHTKIANMDFLEIKASEDILPQLSTLSFVYGIFEQKRGNLVPLDINISYKLHEDFVFGSKYKGKTNEILTQMLINIGLKSVGKPLSSLKLLDPMCGRGTTLLWAMRYGIKAKGIELDPKALQDIRNIVKKWSKVHHQKHDIKDGFIGGKQNKKDPNGKFLEFKTNEASMRVITGDTYEATYLLNGEKFDLIVSDIPYGIHHLASKKVRNPISLLEECADEWADSLKKDGVMVLAFNNYLPKRAELVELFEEHGFEELEFQAPHRMSESIVRDIVVMRKTS
jgi:SAM-dependent methyltransferase